MSAQAENVGYYDMNAGEGNTTTQEPPILASGHTPVNMTDLTSADLAGIDVLLVQNPNNQSYGAEYLSRLADIEAAVNGGMVLVIYDRFVSDAETILPGGAGFDIQRDFNDDANIEILNDTTVLTTGLDNTSLDGGNSSSHGFAVAGSLPGDSLLLLSRTDPGEIVFFVYEFGSGYAMYSSIPMDFYLGGAGPSPTRENMVLLSANSIEYAVELSNLRVLLPPLAIPTLSESTRVVLMGLILLLGLLVLSNRAVLPGQRRS